MIATDHEPSRSCYQRGCKERACAEANNRYKADRQAAHKARTQAATEAYRLSGGEGGIPSLRHGEPNTYWYYSCRCDECKKGVRPLNKKYRRQYRIRVLSLRMAIQATQH